MVSEVWCNIGITPVDDLNVFGHVPVLCKKLQRSKHV